MLQKMEKKKAACKKRKRSAIQSQSEDQAGARKDEEKFGRRHTHKEKKTKEK
jgi:hypothetical protein